MAKQQVLPVPWQALPAVGGSGQTAYRVGNGWLVQGGLTARLLLIHAPNAIIVQYMLKELGRKAVGGGTREGLTPPPGVAGVCPDLQRR